MDLRTYLAALRKSWLMILIATVLGTAAGTVLYLNTPPTYATTIDFYISTPTPDTSNPQAAGQFAEARVNSYIVLLSSEQMGRRVVDLTGLDLTPQQVARQIEASSQLNTVIVTATVTNGDPERSVQIAQGVAEGFPDLVDELDNQGRRSDVVVISVVSGPTLQRTPVSPDPKIYIGLGILGGLVLGLVVAILREVLDNSVRTVESAQRLVGAPVLGTIPYDPDTRRTPLIVGEEAASLRSEAYRQLRTNLQFINAARSANVIMITSSVPIEGKSTTAVNLALTFMEFGERVLLIDADLRRPQLNSLLGLPNDVGLTNVLAGQISLDQVLQPWGEDGRLTLLASGSVPPNPSELLGSVKMAELIPKVRQRFDKIVIDTPPVLPVTDAAVASVSAEAVVMVIRHGRTSRAQVSNAAATLENIDAQVVGSVLNMRKTSRTERRRYGHRGYFGTQPYGRGDTPPRPTARPTAAPVAEEGSEEAVEQIPLAAGAGTESAAPPQASEPARTTPSAVTRADDDGDFDDTQLIPTIALEDIPSPPPDQPSVRTGSTAVTEAGDEPDEPPASGPAPKTEPAPGTNGSQPEEPTEAEPTASTDPGQGPSKDPARNGADDIEFDVDFDDVRVESTELSEKR